MHATQNEEVVFLTALEIDSPAERAAYLDAACEGKSALRLRVEKLLARHQESAGMLDAPPPGIDAANNTAIITEKPGTLIGPYKLLEQIGEGGFGIVFLAEQTTPVRRRVALKIVKPGMDTRQVINRFEAERQALAMMDHPNIAKVLDAGTTGEGSRDWGLGAGEESRKSSTPYSSPQSPAPHPGRPYFVMELVQGVPITEYCDQCNLSTRERLELFVIVCQAVQHAHQKGIIHRDLKPTNILVAIQDGRPAPKIIDFGVAKALNQRLTEHTLATGFAQMIGTPLYMSPEQAELSPLGADTRSDIYSLGVLLYELLTGTTPFDKDRLHSANFDELRRILREEDPPRPSARISTLAADLATTVAERRRTDAARLSQQVRGELDWIVMKCLEKDRTRRYETASGVARDIAHYLNDEPVSACPPSTIYRLRKFARRHKTPLSAVVLVTLALLAGTAASTWQAIRATRAERLAQTRYEAERIARQETEQARREADTDRLRATRHAAAATAAAAKSEATVNLLQQMLTPEVERAHDYTVRQMLDDFSDRLSERFEDQPELEAEIRTIIGGVYQKLSMDQTAEPHLRAALELRRRQFGPHHPQVGNSLLACAWNANARGQLVQSESQAREALAIARQHGDGRPVLAALHALQNFLTQQGKYREAESFGSEALAMVQSLNLERDSVACDVLHVLASSRIGQGRWIEAEDLTRQALAIAANLNGEHEYRTAVLQACLVIVLQARGAYDEAEEICRPALATLQAYLGKRHASIARMTQQLALILLARGDHQAAEEKLLKARSIALELTSEDPGNFAHVRLLNTIRWTIAEMYARQGLRDKAVQEWTQIIEREPDNAEAWFWRGEVHRRSLHQWDQAIVDYAKAIELDPERADARDKLAWILVTRPNQSLRDPPRALRLAQEAIAREPDEGPYWNTLGVAHYRAGQWQKAIEALEESVRLYEGRDLSFNGFFLAMAHWRLGHKDESRRWYDDAVAWMREQRPDDQRLVAFRMEADELMGLSNDP